MSHKKKSSGPGGVNLGLIITPMLDMSFQILAFFIMTYHPSAFEGHIPGSLIPPEEVATKSKDSNPTPQMEQNLSIPEDLLDPSLNEAVLVQVKSVVKGQDVDKHPEGSPSQIFVRTTLETDKTMIADVDVPVEQAMKLLESHLKDMVKKGSNKTNLKIAADGDLRQQWVMRVYDACKRAGFEKLHFVPPPVLNDKFNKK